MITNKVRKARVATFIGFLLLGAMMYVWSTGVSAFRHQMGLSGDAGDVNFGLLALGIGIGSSVGAFIVGGLIDRFGAKAVVCACLIGYPLSIIPMGFVSEFYFALTFGAVLGLLRGALDTAINAHGIQVERFYQRPIMSAFHAFYALGGFFAGMAGSWFSGLYHESASVQFSVMGGVILVSGALVSFWLLGKNDVPALEAAPAGAEVSGSLPVAPTSKAIVILMVGLGLLLLGAMIGESVIGDWGQEFVRREFATTAALAGVAVSTFTGAEFVGRFLGDRLAARFGSTQVIFCSSIIAIVGLVVVVLGGSAATSIAGFGLFGLGMSCIAPLLLSSAGRMDPANAGRNIAIVNSIGYSGMLVAPAAITLIVNAFGLGALIYLPIVMMMLLALFGPLMLRTPKSQSSVSPTTQWAATPK